MRTIYRAWSCKRPLWFRPSAIAVGWVLAQILYQFLSRGDVYGTCGDGTVAFRC
jgi:hypothetical protein